jgi:hypothetical protein
MDLLGPALHAAASPDTGRSATSAPWIIIGAGGALGSALLAEMLARAGQGRVLALVDEKLNSALRSFVPLPRAQLLRADALPAGTALLVFERARHSNGRDDAFVQPQPDEMLPLARQLAACGVARLIVVVPHLPALLPGALRHGFASHDEAALATLGFEQLLILRPAQALALPGEQSGLAAFAQWWLSQLRWMIPQQQQPLRVVRLASLVAELALLLEQAPPGHRIVPAELLWQAGQSQAPAAMLLNWLRSGQGPTSG